MIKGIIFDIDGVILDSMGIWNDLGARYLLSIGKEPEEGLNTVLFSMSMEQGAEYLKKHYKIRKSTAAILEGIRQMLESFYFNEVLVKPGVKELMEFFKSRGIRMTVATSSPRMHVEKALSRNGIYSYIEALYTTSEIGVSKHSPDIFYKAAEYMTFDAHEVVVFEDSLYALETAKKAGFKTVGVYDKEGETDQDGVKTTSDLYVLGLDEVITRWEELDK